MPRESKSSLVPDATKPVYPELVEGLPFFLQTARFEQKAVLYLRSPS